MALVWKGLDAIVSGPFLMLVLQVVLVWTGVALILGRKRVGSVLLCLFFPPVFSIIGVIWKDIQMAAGLVVGAALLLKALEAFPKFGWKPATASLIAFAYATGMRHNAIAAVLPFVGLLALALVAHFVFSQRRSLGHALCMSFAVSVVSFGAIASFMKPIESALDVEKKDFWQSVPLYDISGIISNVPDEALTSEVRTAIDNGLNGYTALRSDELRAAIRKFYAPSYSAHLMRQAGPLRMSPDGEAHERLKSLWWLLVKEHPRAFFVHKKNVSRFVIGLEPPLWAPVWAQPFEDSAKIRSELKMDYNLSPAQHALFDLLERLSKGFLFRAWKWLIFAGALFLACCWNAFSLMRKGQDATWENRGRALRVPLFAAALCLSGATYEASVLAGAGSFDYRYSHWMIFATWLAALFVAPHLLSEVSAFVRAWRARIFPTRA